MKLHIHRQELQAAFTGNVRFTKNFFLRAVPVILKNPVMALNYYLLGVRPYSCTYTNPGAFAVPPEMASHIQGMEVILGQATVPRCHCASISYGNPGRHPGAGGKQPIKRSIFLCLTVSTVAWS